jgi:CDP-diacylglycerol--serine O-phosphatidyltransferase
MKRILKDIQTGEYAKSFILENRAGAPTLQSAAANMAEHSIEHRRREAARDDAVDQEEQAGRPDRATDLQPAIRGPHGQPRGPSAWRCGILRTMPYNDGHPTWAPTTRSWATRRLRPRRKGLYVLPNLFTLAALFGGFYAIVMAMNGRFENAAIGIFCAMVLDSLDGRVARMTGTQSAFGEQMDSLSDMVSFGAAPALVVYEWALKDFGKIGWIVAFVYCACAALRLARFNVNTGVVDKAWFQGLPSPAAAALVAGSVWVSVEAGWNPQHEVWLHWLMLGITAYAGLTMVTNACLSTASSPSA